MSETLANKSICLGKTTHHWAQKQEIDSYYFTTLDSTNSKAKAEAFNEHSFNKPLILYLAGHQSAGKGRGQNSWVSDPSGSQLLSTWSFMSGLVPQPIISPMMGLALYRAANASWPFLNWNLKAPNDLYINSKKVAGILLETVSQGDDHRLLLGLGINIISSPDFLPTTATSLAVELSKDAPLLTEDWIAFLERLHFEFSFSLQLSVAPMNTTSTHALLTALNKHPLLKEKYISVDEHGNLATAFKNTSWTEL